MSKWDELEKAAKAAKGWEMNLSRQLEGEDEAGLCSVGSLHGDGDFAEVMIIDTGNYNAPQEAKKLGDFYAAANPAAILKLLEINAELVGALKRIKTAAGATVCNIQWVEQHASAAIAKAEGEQS